MPNIARKGRRLKEKKPLGNSSGDNAEWWRKVRRGNQKWSRGHRPVYLHLPRAIQAAEKLQQIKKMLVFPVFSFSFNKFCRSRSVPYQPISSSQLPTVVWERWQGWSETCATSETSRARWRRHQRRHQQQDRQHSFTMELSQPARLTWNIGHKLLMVGSKHGSDVGKLLIAIVGIVELSLKYWDFFLEFE